MLWIAHVKLNIASSCILVWRSKVGASKFVQDKWPERKLKIESAFHLLQRAELVSLDAVQATGIRIFP
jgi:hypothetical protein